MKRTMTTLTMLAAFAAVGMAQNNNSSNNSSNSSTTTPQQIMDDLRGCLDSKGVSYQLAPSMNSNELFLIIAPGTPNGHVQSCLVQYNHEAENTPGAPILVRAEFFDF